jgi:hypothetical protein
MSYPAEPVPESAAFGSGPVIPVSGQGNRRPALRRYATWETLSPIPVSYLAISHPASDIEAEKMAQMAERLNRMMAEKVSFRDRAGVARFFDGLELVEPGLVRAQLWQPDSELTAASPAALWGGVARKR